MGVKLINQSIENIKADAAVFPVTEEKMKYTSVMLRKVERQIKELGFKGELGKSVFIASERLMTKGVLLVGIGKEKEVSLEKIRKAYSVAFGEATRLNLQSISAQIINFGLAKEDVVKTMVEGVLLSDYRFGIFKVEKKKAVKEFIISGEAKYNGIVKEAEKICGNVNLVRDLVNEPGTTMNPIKIEEVAKKVAKGVGLKLKVFNEGELKKMGMNAMLAVGSGSRYPPRLLIMEYYGNRASSEKIAIVGKGITFDSGGINLKPTGYIETMKLDKAGAVTVLGLMKTLAELKIKKNVIGFMPLCENMIGPNSYKPGDLIKSYSGKTMEIANTDAEGRVELSDVLAYAEKTYKPKLIVDLATLTGAALVVFGEYVCPMVSTSDKYAEKLFEAGQKLYERVWRLPLYEEYMDEMKGEISDLKNIGYRGSTGGYAGVLTGAAFLKNFVEKTPWIHLDIVGTAWYEKPRYYIPKGGTGWGLRLLLDFLKSV